MGERQRWLLEPTFQRAVKVAVGSDRLTSDGGAVLLREADHRLGLSESAGGRAMYAPCATGGPPASAKRVHIDHHPPCRKRSWQDVAP